MFPSRGCPADPTTASQRRWGGTGMATPGTGRNGTGRAAAPCSVQHRLVHVPAEHPARRRRGGERVRRAGRVGHVDPLRRRLRARVDEEHPVLAHDERQRREERALRVGRAARASRRSPRSAAWCMNSDSPAIAAVVVVAAHREGAALDVRARRGPPPRRDPRRSRRDRRGTRGARRPATAACSRHARSASRFAWMSARSASFIRDLAVHRRARRAMRRIFAGEGAREYPQRRAKRQTCVRLARVARTHLRRDISSTSRAQYLLMSISKSRNFLHWALVSAQIDLLYASRRVPKFPEESPMSNVASEGGAKQREVGSRGDRVEGVQGARREALDGEHGPARAPLRLATTATSSSSRRRRTSSPTKIGEVTTLAIPLGIAAIVIAWVLTAFYVAWANKSYDPEVERLKGELKR